MLNQARPMVKQPIVTLKAAVTRLLQVAAVAAAAEAVAILLIHHHQQTAP